MGTRLAEKSLWIWTLWLVLSAVLGVPLHEQSSESLLNNHFSHQEDYQHVELELIEEPGSDGENKALAVNVNVKGKVKRQPDKARESLDLGNQNQGEQGSRAEQQDPNYSPSLWESERYVVFSSEPLCILKLNCLDLCN